MCVREEARGVGGGGGGYKWEASIYICNNNLHITDVQLRQWSVRKFKAVMICIFPVSRYTAHKLLFIWFIFRDLSPRAYIQLDCMRAHALCLGLLITCVFYFSLVAPDYIIIRVLRTCLCTLYVCRAAIRLTNIQFYMYKRNAQDSVEFVRVACH